MIRQRGTRSASALPAEASSPSSRWSLDRREPNTGSERDEHSLSPLASVLLTSARAQIVGAWSSLHRRWTDRRSGTIGAGLADGRPTANRGRIDSEPNTEASMMMLRGASEVEGRSEGRRMGVEDGREESLAGGGGEGTWWSAAGGRGIKDKGRPAGPPAEAVRSMAMPAAASCPSPCAWSELPFSGRRTTHRRRTTLRPTRPGTTCPAP